MSTTWGYLREGLLADLNLPDAQALADKIEHADVDHIQAALDRSTPPSDDLMADLLRYYLTVPPLYFVDRPTATSPAA